MLNTNMTICLSNSALFNIYQYLHFLGGFDWNVDLNILENTPSFLRGKWSKLKSTMLLIDLTNNDINFNNIIETLITLIKNQNQY